MMKVISSLSHGVKLNEIGRIIQSEARKSGYKVIMNLCSHGIGKSLHETPNDILPFYSKDDKRVLKEGMVITIEPFLSTGAEYAVESPDGWTLCVSPDNSFFKNTILSSVDLGLFNITRNLYKVRDYTSVFNRLF